MYFPLPTFDPGPVAAWTGLVLLAYWVVTPVLQRRRALRVMERLLAGDRGVLFRESRLARWVVLAEVLVLMAFVGSAASVSPADLGLVAPTFGGLGEEGWAFVGGFTALWTFLLVPIGLRGNDRRLRQLRAGEFSPEKTRRILALYGRSRQEYRAVVLTLVLTTVSEFLLVYMALYPLLTVMLDPLAVVFLIPLLGAWQFLAQGGVNMVVGFLFSFTGLYLYTTVASGSLLGPLVAWALYLVLVLWNMRSFVGLTSEDVVSPAPMEVTLLDADGTPISR